MGRYIIKELTTLELSTSWCGRDDSRYVNPAGIIVLNKYCLVQWSYQKTERYIKEQYFIFQIIKLNLKESEILTAKNTCCKRPIVHLYQYVL